MRRFAFALLVCLSFTLTWVMPAWAGSYLDRAALMLEQAHSEGDFLQPRSFDKELVLVVKALAETRARMARKMEVPAAVAKIMPIGICARSQRASESPSSPGMAMSRMARWKDSRAARARIAAASSACVTSNPLAARYSATASRRSGSSSTTTILARSVVSPPLSAESRFGMNMMSSLIAVLRCGFSHGG